MVANLRRSKRSKILSRKIGVAVVAVLFFAGLQAYLLWSVHHQQHHPESAASSLTNGSLSNVSTTATTLTATNATFHGLALDYVSTHRPSHVHCAGENFLPSSWIYKSCRYQHVCWDLQEGDFVVFESEHEAAHHRSFATTGSSAAQQQLSPYARSSTAFDQAVVSTIGNLPHAVVRQQKQNVNSSNPYKWSPRVVSMADAKASVAGNQGYYQLPLNVVWAPISTHPTTTQVGSSSRILTDYLFPIYNLLAMFDLTPTNDDERTGGSNKQLLITTLNENCASSNCSETFRPFLPLMNLAPGHGPLQRTGQIQGLALTTNYKQQQEPVLQSNYVCARTGVAGIGALTDHGQKSHGERVTDYAYSQNTGRGPVYHAFQQYVLANLGLKGATATTAAVETTGANNATTTRRRMTISVSASKRSGVQTFFEQQASLRQQIPAAQLSIEQQDMAKLTLRQQIQVATQSTFYVSVMGDGTFPAFFMPRGSTLIIYYNNVDELVQGTRRNTTRPAMMDWDLWNNLSHLRVHWLPLKSFNKRNDLRVLVDLVRNELDYLAGRESLDRLERITAQAPADGSYSGLDVRLVNRSQSSSASAVHCVGDNFVEKEAFCYRSCEIENLCLDIGHGRKSFEVQSSELQSKLNESLAEWNRDYAVVSTRLDSGVMEGRSVRFAEKPWFPSLAEPFANGLPFYELPSDVAWIPFTLEYSYAKNPGHLMWDFFLPFYTLLEMFDAKDKRLLVTSLDSTCGFIRDCKKVVSKFLPLLGSSASKMFKQVLSSNHQGEPQSTRICARHGAAGIGMLTDHGFTRHGQNIGDYKRVHNAGRGPMLWAFRCWMLRNMGMDTDTLRPHKRRRVSFSINSSNNPNRRKDFAQQIAAIESAFSNSNVEVKVYEMATLSLEEQIQAVLDTSVFVSVIGGSTSIATFLPRGSSLILYFNDANSFVGGKTKKKDSDFPTMMDFDFWNNAAYVKAHWLPSGSMDDDLGLQTLVRLIKHELDTGTLDSEND